MTVMGGTSGHTIYYITGYYDYGGSLAALLGLVNNMVASWTACCHYGGKFDSMSSHVVTVVASWMACQPCYFTGWL